MKKSSLRKEAETESKIAHNERLEFLGDAVVEFITSVHLFHMFPDLEEGGLATYRAALVQNQHLAILAEVLGKNCNFSHDLQKMSFTEYLTAELEYIVIVVVFRVIVVSTFGS